MLLEKLSMKPEVPVYGEFPKWITDYIRMFMSMHNFSRSELRQGINRILRSGCITESGKSITIPSQSRYVTRKR